MHFFFDFDSTLYAKESLDEVLISSLSSAKAREVMAKKLADICSLGMAGKMDIINSIKERLSLVKLNRIHISNYIKKNKKLQAPVLVLLKSLLKQGHDVFVISNGFKELILPMCVRAGISADNVIANSFSFTKNGVAVIYKKNMPLLAGKGQTIKSIKRVKKLTQTTFMIGDSITDAKAKIKGGADFFIGWDIYIKRPQISNIADATVSRIADFEREVNFLENTKTSR
ncbi:MAG: HAD-IB family phosphatase [SAR324 cluster bacterium]|nr:HAD-IB family phosphatase [SAR324 cluster bacterium]